MWERGKEEVKGEEVKNLSVRTCLAKARWWVDIATKEVTPMVWSVEFRSLK